MAVSHSHPFPALGTCGTHGEHRGPHTQIPTGLSKAAQRRCLCRKRVLYLVFRFNNGTGRILEQAPLGGCGICPWSCVQDSAGHLNRHVFNRVGVDVLSNLNYFTSVHHCSDTRQPKPANFKALTNTNLLISHICQSVSIYIINGISS